MSIDPTDRALPASANFEKLKVKLRELFELDKADLDFGIYRILRVRHKEIAEFLDKHLEKTVREALQLHSSVHQAQVEEDLRKAELAAKEAGIAPEQSPRVMGIREKLHDENSIDALADEVYSQLYTFFSRYYQEGDFLGLQRSTVHGRERYMIPYNGEEVKLVWANMDQYYIKSSELLRDYTFHVTPGEGTLLKATANERTTIHFKLVEGDTEKDNRKPSGKTTRAFALDAETPFMEDAPDILSIRFRYRELAAERNLQDKLNADTEKTLADNLPQKWKEVLFAADPGYQGKDKKDIRTILQKHLRTYTAKHQFDYFIHKDLGGFLRRELDFYIKNEVMYLDDIENVGAPKAEEYLSKIRALRRCALPVIGMLEQLENFQKKLWLKKKFVVETRYCLTLDRVPEALYPEIIANSAQREEWVKLYAINEIEPNLIHPGYSEPLKMDFLKANPYLMIDTRHFDRDFTLKLLAAIDNLDESLDGVCFHSENYQALQLMQERYLEQVKCVYVDPPYNTGGDGFFYRDSYQHSSWISMVSDRLKLTVPLLEQGGVFYSSIDAIESDNLNSILSDSFGRSNRVEEIIWVQNTTKNQSPTISTNHEYVIVYAKHLPTAKAEFSMFREVKPGCAEIKALIDQLNPHFPKTAEIEAALKNLFREHKNRVKLNGLNEESDPWKGIYNYSRAEYRNNDGRYIDESEAKKVEAQIWVWREDNPSMPQIKEDSQKAEFRDSNDPTYRFYNPTHPITGKPCPAPKRGWSWPYSAHGKQKYCFESLAADNRIAWGDDETKIPQTKRFLIEVETNVAKSVVTDFTDGEKELTSIFGKTRSFAGPKPTTLMERFFRQSATLGKLIMDYFSGSGTSVHATINLNREDGGQRKYLLVEMGEHFNSVLVPRLKKVVYSTEWKDGKPQNRKTGISHAFKIVRLESYEDALNNLRLTRTVMQEAALKAAPEKTRDQYLLSYFLDVESAGSASLLDLDQFRDPFAYKLKIATASAGETKDTTIDLVETFNWLLGLKVKQIKAQQNFLTVTGEKRAGGRTLVIWRTLSADTVADNASLEKFLNTLKVKPADSEFDYIYVNGSHTLTDPHNKVHLIEEAFQRLMFDGGSFESLE